MVILIRKRLGDTDLNPREGFCISHIVNTLGKRMDPGILPQFDNQKKKKTMHLNLFNSAKKLILGQILVDVKGLVITKKKKKKKKFIRLFVAIYPIYQPLRSGRIWHKVNFKRSLTGFNSEFSLS